MVLSPFLGVLYSPSVQILICLKDQFFFLKWLQIDSDLSCQIIEIPSSFFFSVTFSAFIVTFCLVRKRELPVAFSECSQNEPALLAVFAIQEFCTDQIL